MKKHEHMEFLEKVEDLSWQCGINQRYHQSKLTRYSMIDGWTRISTGVLAVFALVFSSVDAAGTDNNWVTGLTLALALFAAIAAVVLNVSPAVEKEQSHRDLFRRWSDLRQEVDIYKVRIQGNTQDYNVIPEMLVRYQDLLARKNGLNGMEPSPDRDLLRKCEEDENQSRYDYRNAEERDEKYDSEEKATELVA